MLNSDFKIRFSPRKLDYSNGAFFSTNDKDTDGSIIKRLESLHISLESSVKNNKNEALLLWNEIIQLHDIRGRLYVRWNSETAFLFLHRKLENIWYSQCESEVHHFLKDDLTPLRSIGEEYQ